MADRAAPPPRRARAKRAKGAKGAKGAKEASPAAKVPRRRRNAVRFALAGVVLVGLLFAFVYPTRTFLDQRSDTTRARHQLDLLRSENEKLEDAAARLQDPAEIEKLARRYGLVKPGEQSFVIVPAPEAAPVGAAAPPEGTEGTSP